MLEVEATGGLGSRTGSKLLIDSDAPAMDSTTGTCVFRCKSGVHVIVNSVYGIDTGLSCFSSQAAISNGCLRRRCQSRLIVDLLLYTRSALQRSQRAVFWSGVNVFNFQHMLFFLLVIAMLREQTDKVRTSEKARS